MVANNLIVCFGMQQVDRYVILPLMLRLIRLRPLLLLRCALEASGRRYSMAEGIQWQILEPLKNCLLLRDYV